MVLHRLSDPGSKLSLMRWKEKVFRPQFQQLQLQHLYRSLDFLAECKDEIEGRLFEGIRDLFNLELDLLLWCASNTLKSLYFCRGGVKVG